MAGIYIHIPFCRHKCNYCNFYSLASTRHMPEVTAALQAEIQQRNKYLGNELVETIYFGGGTPSLLKAQDIEDITGTVFRNFNIADNVEITLEANPDDLSPEKLRTLKNTGINRLSIGIQSFREADLDYLSRTHTELQVTQCIENALQAGFHNLSIDLIYGIPTLSDADWEQNLEKAFSFGIPHISAYSLTIEGKTPLEVMIRKGKMNPVDENLALSQYHMLCEKMLVKGYEHYEVSNFCLPGAYSKHNTAYWLGKHYVGIGPSAHSFNGISRSWNVAHLERYIGSAGAGKVETEYELLSPVTQRNEYIMTSLRTMWGLELNYISEKFGSGKAEILLINALPFIDAKHMIYSEDKLVLTSEGLLFADGIAATLFEDE